MKTEETKSDAGQEQEWKVLDGNMIYEGDKFIAITTNPRCAKPIVDAIRASIAKVREKWSELEDRRLEDLAMEIDDLKQAQHESFVPIEDQIAIAVKPYVDVLKFARKTISDTVWRRREKIKQLTLDKIDALLAQYNENK